MKDAVSSFMGNHEQAAKAVKGVNIVSDGNNEMIPLASSNDIPAEAITGTQ